MAGLLDMLFGGGGGLLGIGQKPQPQQYDWLPPTPPATSTNRQALMGLGLGLAGGQTAAQGMQLGLQGMMTGANNDILQQQRLDALNQNREQTAAMAALVNKIQSLTPEQKRFLTTNPKAWEALSSAIVNPTIQVVPGSGDVINQGQFGQISRVGGVPVSEKGEVWDPKTGRPMPAWMVKPNLGNPQGGVVMPQTGGQGGEVTAPARGKVVSSPKWWGDQEAQNAGLYDRGPQVFSGPSARETAEGTGTGKMLSDQAETLAKEGVSATKTKQTLQRMSQLVGKTYQGAAANLQQGARSVLASFGVDPGPVPAGEEFTALSNTLVTDATGGSLGNQISNSDVKFLAARNPQMTNTDAGKRELIETATLIADRKQQVAKMATEWRARKGTMEGFNDAIAQWAERNPLFANREHVGSFEDRFGSGKTPLGQWQEMGGGVRIRQVK